MKLFPTHRQVNLQEGAGLDPTCDEAVSLPGVCVGGGGNEPAPL